MPAVEETGVVTTGSPAPATDNEYFGESEVPLRPKLVGTYQIVGIEDPTTTANGDYEMAELQVNPTRGSHGAGKIRLMFREEQFMPGFKPNVYDAIKTPNEPPKRGTKGDSFKFVYRSSIKPPMKKEKVNGVEVNVLDAEGNSIPLECSIMMAICGGTMKGVKALNPYLREITVDGKKPTSQEIVDAFRKYLRENPPKGEVLAILKQSKDRSGCLTDNYELAQFEGPLNATSHADMAKRSAASQKKEVISQRLNLTYHVG